MELLRMKKFYIRLLNVILECCLREVINLRVLPREHGLPLIAQRMKMIWKHIFSQYKSLSRNISVVVYSKPFWSKCIVTNMMVHRVNVRTIHLNYGKANGSYTLRDYNIFNQHRYAARYELADNVSPRFGSVKSPCIKHIISLLMAPLRLASLCDYLSQLSIFTAGVFMSMLLECCTHTCIPQTHTQMK